MKTNAPRMTTRLIAGVLFGLSILLMPTVSQAQWTTTSAGDATNNNSSGKVGIGTTTPADLFHIYGSGKGVRIQTSDPAVGSYFSSYWSDNAQARFTYHPNTAVTYIDNYYLTTVSGQPYGDIRFRARVGGGTSLSEVMTLSGFSGNVGIGETSPTRSLTIRKDVANGVGAGIYLHNNQYANNSGAETEIVFGHLESGGNPMRYAKIHSVGADPYGSVNSFSFGLTDNTDTYQDRLTLVQNGNVGIGETSPIRSLTIRKDVANGVGAGIYLHNNQYANNSGAETEIVFGHLESGGSPMRYAKLHSVGADPYGSVNSFSFGLTDSTDTYRDRLTILQNGNIGIGTTSPSSLLHLASGGKIALNNPGNTNGGGIQVTATSSPTGADVNIFGGGGIGTGLFVENSGKVGIGKTNPTAALDVQGDIKLSGSIAARYQDLAEWVPASEQLSAGTVVILDSTKLNQVTSSSVSYDTRVAGVISEQPGIALGEKSEGKVLVATTGRVRVKVDATKGPIHVGDLLVTSDVSGVAMKSEAVNLGGVQFHRPGTLIGKALEPLEKGRGEILVLLSLQ